MGNLFNIIFYQPILNGLIFIYNNLSFGSFGIAIIILTLVVRLLMAPISFKAAKDQAIMQKIAPKIKDLQKKHKDNQELQVKEIMGLYSEHKVNPMRIFGLIFAQAIVLWNLYRVFQDGLGNFTGLYSFVHKPEIIGHMFIGFDLSKPEIGLTLIAAGIQFVLSWLSFMAGKSQIKKTFWTGLGMAVFSGFTTTLILVILKLPSAIAIYWIATTVFSVAQQIIINKSLEKNGGIA